MLLDLHVFHLSFFEVIIEYVSFLGSANYVLTVGRDAEFDVVRGDLELRILELVHQFSLANVPYLQRRVLSYRRNIQLIVGYPGAADGVRVRIVQLERELARTRTPHLDAI